MYGLVGHPLLDFLVVAGGIGLGYLVVVEPQGVFAGQSARIRFAALLVIAFFAIEVLAKVLSMLSPLLNGAANSQSALEFVGGLLLIGALIAAYLALRGDLTVNLRVADTAVPPSAMNGDGGRRCPRCSNPVRPDGLFCPTCGASVNRPTAGAATGGGS
jgi:hypothetical protein